MKEGIHPKYNQTTITCACGEVIATGSTKENIRVEICSKCHPFFTGKQKLVDAGGRVDRFHRRFGMQNEKSAADTQRRRISGRPDYDQRAPRTLYR